jgi:hypothetical protein
VTGSARPEYLKPSADINTSGIYRSCAGVRSRVRWLLPVRWWRARAWAGCGRCTAAPFGRTGPLAPAHEPPTALDGLDLPQDWFDGPADLGIAGLAQVTFQLGPHRGPQAVALGRRGLAVLAGLAAAAVAGRRDQQLRRVGDRRHVGDRPTAGVGRQPLWSSIDASGGQGGYGWRSAWGAVARGRWPVRSARRRPRPARWWRLLGRCSPVGCGRCRAQSGCRDQWCWRSPWG